MITGIRRILAGIMVAALLLTVWAAPAVQVSAEEAAPVDKICIVLDPGHGGTDSGTVTTANVNGTATQVKEKDCAWKVAQYAKEALEADGRFEVYLTREGDTAISLADRAVFGRDKEADVLVSIHFNSASSKEAKGAEVWQSVLPKYQIANLPGQILSSIGETTGLDITRGVKSRKSESGNCWNDTANWDTSAQNGTAADYYGLIRQSARWGLPAMIVEHAFFSNTSDLAYITQADEAGLKALGEADAKALIDFYSGHTHNYGNAETEYPLSCVSGGRQAQHCTVCKAKKNVSAIAAAANPNAHFADTYKVVKKATASSEGTEQGTCLYCGKTVTRSIAKLASSNKSTVAEQTVKITVSRAAISKVKKKRKGKKFTVTVTAKKIKGVAGYQFSYGSNKKITKNKKVKNKKSNKLTVTSWKKKNFYVHVRAYKYKPDGTKVYGKWSAVKKK